MLFIWRIEGTYHRISATFACHVFAYQPLKTHASYFCSYEDLRDAIKTAAPRSPLDSLPQYSMIETGPGSRQLSKEESFNISISPVKRDPFSAFNR